MQVIPNKIPDPEAIRGFVEGMQNLQDYLRTNASARLTEAEEQFNDSLAADPNFAPSQYYKAIALTHARRADEAAQILQSLDRDDVPFRTEVLYNLAFAYGKTYTYENVELALETIDEAETKATDQNRDDLRLLVIAVKAWVNAVFGAYDFKRPRDDFEKRQRIHLPEAVKLAKSALEDPALKSLADETRLAVQVEAYGAAGGALMYMGQFSARFPEPITTDQYWTEAEVNYNAALQLHPRNVRVLDDKATLYLMRASRAWEKKQTSQAEEFAREALKTQEKSISYHAHDAFRYYQRAQIFALLGKWESAKADAYRVLKEPGVVSKHRVAELKGHIRNRKLELILERYKTEEKSVP
jgi:tetratricopeptide (TPR) repeat protein